MLNVLVVWCKVQLHTISKRNLESLVTIDLVTFSLLRVGVVDIELSNLSVLGQKTN